MPTTRVLGRTYNEIGGEARSMHKCQGMSQLLPLPARRRGLRVPAACAATGCATRCSPDGVNRTENDLFDGVDTRIVEPRGVRRRAGARGADRRGSTRIADRGRRRARGAGQERRRPRRCRRCCAGSSAVRELRSRLAVHGDRRRRAVRDRSAAAAQGRAVRRRRCCSPPTCGSRRSRATAWSSPVSPCRSICSPPIAATVVPVMMSRRSLSGFDVKRRAVQGRRADARAGEPADVLGHRTRCRPTRGSPPRTSSTPPTPRASSLDPDVPPGLPFRPTPFTRDVRAQHRRRRRRRRRCRCSSAPRATSSAARSAPSCTSSRSSRCIVTPEIAIVPTAATPATARGADREIRVTVTNHSKGAAKARGRARSCRTGWRATPADVAGRVHARRRSDHRALHACRRRRRR